MQLHGAIHFPLLAPSNVFANGFGGALYRFGGDFQTGQQRHLPTSVIKGGLASHGGKHAPHSGREILLVDIQVQVGWELAVVAVWAEVVRAHQFDLAEHRENPSPAHLSIARFLTTLTGNQALVRTWLGVAQQLAERRRSGVMQGGAHSHLQGFQIGVSGFASFGEEAA
jgi:hypothetical protein